MKALAYAFSAENPHALRNILLVAVTVAYLAVIVVLFLRLRHANQKMADRMKELNKQKQAEQAAKEAETAAQERVRNCSRDSPSGNGSVPPLSIHA